MNRSAPLEFEIWCSVVDNFGDAGVCWRLARQLAGQWRFPVTLRIDHLSTLAAIEPRARPAKCVDAVRILDWHEDAPHDPTGRSVVVSAFGCELPGRVRARLAAAHSPSLWVNLEYLSAEPWIEGCHRLASVKPSDGLVEHFFYPGFTAATGGLLRERGLFERRDAFRASVPAYRWLASLGVACAPDEFRLSMFCYPDAPLERLCTLLGESRSPVHLLLAGGVDTPPLAGAPARRSVESGVIHRGAALTVSRVPWLTQDDYDRLLWSCDLNFVRGEDSWVRAHWAGVPFVWQPYRQAEDAHLAKLDAFVARLARAVPADPRAPGGAAADMMRAWSGEGSLADAWLRYRGEFEALRELHRAWTQHLAGQRDLATSLVEFCQDRL